MLISVMVTCIATKETPYQVSSCDATAQRGSFFAMLMDMLRRLSPLARWVWTALCFTNFAWFVSWMYIPAYMGIEVVHGNPNAEEHTVEQRLYHEGADLLASRAMPGQSLLSVFLSMWF